MSSVLLRYGRHTLQHRRAKSELALSEIHSLIAHRSPILFVSKVSNNAPGITLCAHGTLEDDRDRLQLPRRLRILEGMGQASALLIAQTPRYISTQRDMLPVFAAMNNVIWKEIPVDQENENTINVLYKVHYAEKIRARFGFVDASAIVLDKKVCSAQLAFSFIPKCEHSFSTSGE